MKKKRGPGGGGLSIFRLRVGASGTNFSLSLFILLLISDTPYSNSLEIIHAQYVGREGGFILPALLIVSIEGKQLRKLNKQHNHTVPLFQVYFVPAHDSARKREVKDGTKTTLQTKSSSKTFCLSGYLGQS